MPVNYKLKAIRTEHDLTQEDMADYLSISKVSYSNKETGKSEFKQSEINNILELFANSKYEDIFLFSSSQKRNLIT